MDREDLRRFLPPDLAKPAGEFVNSTLWKAIKYALLARQPENAMVTDPPHVAAARAFKNDGWRDCLEALELLPFEQPTTVAPAIPETLVDQRD